MDTPIAWYPGHMAKARRQIVTGLRLVDAVIEVVDARAPASTANPDLRELIGRRARLIVATKADLADEAATERWLEFWRSQGLGAVAVDLRRAHSRQVLQRGLRTLAEGRAGLRLKVMVVGTPNVGKSTLINLLAGRAAARTGALPGVTRSPQWIHLPGGVHLLDTPGMMWPKIERREVGLRLAWLGCIGEKAFDAEKTAEELLGFLARTCADRLVKRYGIDLGASPDLLGAIAAARGMLVSGGEPDRRRAAETVLREFRGGQLGRITLELPEESV